MKTKKITTTKCLFRMSFARCFNGIKLNLMNGTFGIRLGYFALSGLGRAPCFDPQGDVSRLSLLHFALGYFVSARLAIFAASTQFDHG